MTEPFSAGRKLFPPAKWPSSTQNRPNPSLPTLLAAFVSLALCHIQAFPACRCACFSPFHSQACVLLATFPHCACQGLALLFPTRWSCLLPVPCQPPLACWDDCPLDLQGVCHTGELTSFFGGRNFTVSAYGRFQRVTVQLSIWLLRVTQAVCVQASACVGLGETWPHRKAIMV